MSNFREQMAFYQAYHHHPHNRLTHFVGVPLIILGLFTAMGWARISLGHWDLSLAMVFAAVVMGYYFYLDLLFAALLVFIIAPLLWAANAISTQLSFLASFGVFLAAFLSGAAFQLWGHSIEGRRPALVDNFWQIFIAPIFLMAELCFACGIRKDWHRDIVERSVKFKEKP